MALQCTVCNVQMFNVWHAHTWCELKCNHVQAFKCNSVAVELKQHNALEISRKHFGSFGCVQCTEPCTVRRTLEVCSKELVDTFVVSGRGGWPGRQRGGGLQGEGGGRQGQQQHKWKPLLGQGLWTWAWRLATCFVWWPGRWWTR